MSETHKEIPATETNRMSINFNRVRQMACASYDRLIDRLNYWQKQNEPYSLSNHVQAPVDELQELLEDLRSAIGTIACVYDESQGIECVMPEDGLKMFSCEEDNSESI